MTSFKPTYDELENRIFQLEQEIHTERIRAEKAEENEARYRGLLNNLDAGVVIHAGDTTILFCNPRSSELLGLSEDQMKGKVAIDPYWNFITEDYNPLPVTDYPVMQIINSKKAMKSQILGVFQNQNSIIWLDVNGYPVINDNKEISEIVISFIDITEKKLAEFEIYKAKEKAEENDKLKTAFLQNISHEIRTPMNAIMGFAEMLKKRNLTEEKKNQYIDIINNSSNQLSNIVDDIITSSKIETNQLKIFESESNINQIMDELKAIFEIKASNKKIDFNYKKSLQDKDSIIRTDATKFRQILINLLTNAFKFTVEGNIEFGYILEKEFVEFYIKDTGIGIAEEHHGNIFERFRQVQISTNRSNEGMGLGLSITKSFVELLGGQIWLESELGKGSVFKFTLPYNPIK